MNALRLALGAACVLMSTAAWPADPVTVPTLRRGDFWEWRVTSDVEKPGLRSHEVVAEGDGEVTVRMILPPLFGSAGGRTATTTLDSAGNSQTRHLDFPLHEGKRWTHRVLAPGNGVYTYTYEVQRRERVRVPAGEFQCLRIEAQADMVFASLPPVRTPETFWYCDALRNIARREYSVPRMGTSREELVRYRLAP